jgi:hypothetical protein
MTMMMKMKQHLRHHLQSLHLRLHPQQLQLQLERLLL